MATRVQSKTANSGGVGVTTLSVTFDSALTAGNLLVLTACSVATAGGFVVSEDPNVGWMYYVKTGASNTSTILAVGVIFSGASTTQTVTTASTSGIAIVAAEYSGNDFVLDRTAFSTGTSTTCTSGTTGTTTFANGLWVSGIGHRITNGVTFSAPTNSFTIVGQDKSSIGSTSDRSVCLLEFFPSSTGAASTGVTASASGVFAGAIATLGEASSGSGGGLRLAGHGGLAS